MVLAMLEVLAFLGTWEIILVLLIALLLFGTRLPKVARSMGQGVSEFKRGMRDLKDDVERAADERDPAPENKSKE